MNTPDDIQGRLNTLESEIIAIKDVILQIQSDILDFKEAFEHTDDSLQRVRTTVAGITER